MIAPSPPMTEAQYMHVFYHRGADVNLIERWHR